MPRATKKKETKAPEPAMYMEIFAALRMLEKERGIPVDYMVDKIKQALVNAYRKDREDHRQGPHGSFHVRAPAVYRGGGTGGYRYGNDAGSGEKL